MPVITFQPMGRAVEIESGCTILEAAMRSELFLRHVCGGAMNCATCRSKVLAGAENLSPMSRGEKRRLAELYAPSSARLSCQAQILGDVVVEIPVPKLGT